METSGTRRQKARQGLAIYFAVLVAGSAFLEWKLLATGEPIQKHVSLVFALMWTPAVASIVARLSLREGIRDVSFRFGGREGGTALLTAWLYPLVVGFIAYGGAWATGLAKFQAPIPAQSHLYLPNPTGNFLLAVAVTATAGALFGCVSAAGEEIGWRGYMVTRLIEAGVPAPILVSGLIGGFWHMPLILSGQYASGPHPRLSAMLFMVDVVAAAFLAAYLRLRSGSVWPAILFHGAWNAIIQGAFDRATAGQPIAVGESGYLTAIVDVIVVAIVVRGTWKKLRRPGEDLLPTS